MSKSHPVRLTVIRTEPVARSMRRVVLGGDGFAEFLANHASMAQAYTDTYVKLVFLADGADYPDPLDLDVVRTTMPPATWPVLRTYTIRWIDPAAQELAIDFVVHGDSGVAGPWAAAAQPGDVIHVRGPNGGYAPDPTASWHLFIGDEIDLVTSADLELHWLHRDGAAAGSTTLLDDAIRAWPWRDGRAQAFVHGESALLKTVRPFVLNDRGVARADASISAYWRRDTTEEGFRVWKSEQKDAVMRPGAS